MRSDKYYRYIHVPKPFIREDGYKPQLTEQTAERIEINPDAFKHKIYPNCRCGAKYVPIKGRKCCPRCAKK